MSELAQVVATIGVREHDDVTAGSLKSSPDRQAIAPPGFRDDRRSDRGGRGRATVSGSVVDDDDLTTESCASKPLQRFLNRGCHTSRFIETWQDDRDARGRVHDGRRSML
jgi:hypothetical protein